METFFAILTTLILIMDLYIAAIIVAASNKKSTNTNDALDNLKDYQIKEPDTRLREELSKMVGLNKSANVRRQNKKNRCVDMASKGDPGAPATVRDFSHHHPGGVGVGERDHSKSVRNSSRVPIIVIACLFLYGWSITGCSVHRKATEDHFVSQVKQDSTTTSDTTSSIEIDSSWHQEQDSSKAALRTESTEDLLSSYNKLSYHITYYSDPDSAGNQHITSHVDIYHQQEIKEEHQSNSSKSTCSSWNWKEAGKEITKDTTSIKTSSTVHQQSQQESDHSTSTETAINSDPTHPLSAKSILTGIAAILIAITLYFNRSRIKAAYKIIKSFLNL